MIKQQLKSKTNWFAVVVATLPAALEQLPLLQPYLKENYNMVYVVIAVGIVFFRNITTTSISEK